MKVLYFTNEYPPHIYGGAGVHIQYLAREAAKFADVEVRCYGDQRPENGAKIPATGYDPKSAYDTVPTGLQSIFKTLDRDLQMCGRNIDADVVHCHTWYTHMAGIWAKLNYGIPLVITTHSLEPLRPWKREQLGGGYDFSCWVEKMAIEMADAVIAVSKDTKADVERLFNVKPERLKVIYNGIDTEEYKKTDSVANISNFGFDPKKPYVLFVGRITRQKGISQLIQAIPQIDKNAQVVLCAGAPDTQELADECKGLIEEVQKVRDGVVWIQDVVPHEELRVLYSHATVFATPSLYEPFGIINLEAMSCGTPVVGSAVGGIPEIIVDGETGFLVPLKPVSETNFEPADPKAFQTDFAGKLNRILEKPELAKKMGEVSRKRAIDVFSWKAIAKQTFDFYAECIERYKREGKRK